MLIEFKVKNFLSFRDEVVFSMVAGPDKSLDYNVASLPNSKTKLLKSATIYGANAAGKSNLLRAIEFMARLILTNHIRQEGDPIKVTPFKLDAISKSEPSQFSILFIYEDTKYAYGFTIDQSKVHDEYLYHYPNGRQATIFERTATNQFKFTKDKEEQETLSKRTLDNRLYLGSATEWNYKPVSKAFEWFKKALTINLNEQISFPDSNSAILAHTDSKMKEAIRCLLTEADLSISDYSTKETYAKESFFWNYAIRNLKISTDSNISTPSIIKIQTKHSAKRKDGTLYEEVFEFDEESSGTQKIFELAGPLLEVLANGHILIIDEMDIKLHPLLVENLIKKFHDPIQNPKNAQLIFSTHNTNLLTQTLLRRDQIWFAEKDPDLGSTSIYSLLELGIRKDENIEKGYLAGRYGAVPFIGAESNCVWPK